MNLAEYLLARSMGGGSGGSGGGATPDWNASEGEAGHILNRTHWKEVVEILPETTIQLEGGFGDFIMTASPTPYQKTTVVYNGVRYDSTCVMVTFDGQTSFAIGNLSHTDMGEDTGEPFLIAASDMGNGSIMLFDGSTNESITLSIACEVFKPIDTGYLANAFPWYINVTGRGTTEEPYVFDKTYMELQKAIATGREVKLRRTDGTNTFIYSLITISGVVHIFDHSGSTGGLSQGYLTVYTEDGITLCEATDL